MILINLKSPAKTEPSKCVFEIRYCWLGSVEISASGSATLELAAARVLAVVHKGKSMYVLFNMWLFFGEQNFESLPTLIINIKTDVGSSIPIRDPISSYSSNICCPNSSRHQALSSCADPCPQGSARSEYCNCPIKF